MLTTCGVLSHAAVRCAVPPHETQPTLDAVRDPLAALTGQIDNAVPGFSPPWYW